MTDENKPLKVIIDPQALAEMEEMCGGDPVEMQKVLDEIKQLFESEDFLASSTPVDMDQLMEEDPELAMLLMERFAQYDDADDQTPPSVH